MVLVRRITRRYDKQHIPHMNLELALRNHIILSTAY